MVANTSCHEGLLYYNEVLLREMNSPFLSKTKMFVKRTRRFRPLIQVSAHPGVRGGGGGVLGLIFAGYVELGYPIIFYSVVNYGPHLSHF